jgi:ataxia telangiectasia mutated family protein
MYEIYSNVEDPDGFYGIQTHDVKSALLRRLQHEKQSWRAFGLNGAAFETGSNHRTNGSSALSMMSNLHDMGFDHLSSGLYKATSSSQQGESVDDPLLLELAWRIYRYLLKPPRHLMGAFIAVYELYIDNEISKLLEA